MTPTPRPTPKPDLARASGESAARRDVVSASPGPPDASQGEFAVHLRAVLTQALHEWGYIDMETSCGITLKGEEMHYHEDLDSLVDDLLKVAGQLDAGTSPGTIRDYRTGRMTASTLEGSPS